MGQIADAKARLAQAATEEERSRIQLGMSERELKILETRWREVEREAGDGKKNLDSKRVEVEKLRKKVDNCGWSEEKEQHGQAQLNAAKQQVRQLMEVCILTVCNQARWLLSAVGTRQQETTTLFS
jgi:structural maintenance of chromosome 2